MYLLQGDLDSVMETWNNHTIRRVRNSRSPNGRPSALQRFPELQGTHNYICDVTDNDITLCSRGCVFRGVSPCDEDVFQVCSMVMADNNQRFPSNVDEATVLYRLIHREVHRLLN